MKKIDKILQSKESKTRAAQIKREFENLEEIFPPKRRSDYLIDIYMDLVEYLRELHPTIPISHDVRDLNGYNPLTDSIVDEYKNILHLKLLRRIPHMEIITGIATEMIDDIFKKHGLPEPDLKMATQIWFDLDEIITKRLGPPGKSTHKSR